VKESPARLDAVKQAIQAAGGRLIFPYLLMGEHDLAALTEFPNDEAATKFVLTLGSQGSVRTHTMKAFTEQEYRDLIAGLP